MASLETDDPVRPDFEHGKAKLVKDELLEPIVLDDGIQINKFIGKYLKNYQVEGAKFMYEAYKSGLGCILAGKKTPSRQVCRGDY